MSRTFKESKNTKAEYAKTKVPKKRMTPYKRNHNKNYNKDEFGNYVDDITADFNR